MAFSRRISGTRGYLKRDHPTATMFLDETGAVSSSRIFAIGVLKLAEPSIVLRSIQSLRDREDKHNEVKFTKVTVKKLPFYRAFVDCLATDPGFEFWCFVADRHVADPVERFGTQWDAYGKLAEQLIHGAIAPDEIVTILADNYSAPNDVKFEPSLKRAINRRVNRLAIASVVRLDSKTTDGLQLVDLLTSGIAYEFRRNVGEGNSYAKGEMSAHVLHALGATTCQTGYRTGRHSVAIYGHGTWSPNDPSSVASSDPPSSPT